MKKKLIRLSIKNEIRNLNLIKVKREAKKTDKFHLTLYR